MKDRPGHSLTEEIVIDTEEDRLSTELRDGGVEGGLRGVGCRTGQNRQSRLGRTIRVGLIADEGSGLAHTLAGGSFRFGNRIGILVDAEYPGDRFAVRRVDCPPEDSSHGGEREEGQKEYGECATHSLRFGSGFEFRIR